MCSSREHDKDPETFFTAVQSLKRDGLQFTLSVLGEQYSDNPGMRFTHPTHLHPPHTSPPNSHHRPFVLKSAIYISITCNYKYYERFALSAHYLFTVIVTYSHIPFIWSCLPEESLLQYS